MHESFIKRSYKYCTYNKKFLVLVVILILLANMISDSQRSFYFKFISLNLINIFNTGYGLQITKDVIGYGKRLPKIMPRTIMILGIKGSITTIVYLTIQISLLTITAHYFNFPIFNINDIFINPYEIIMLFFTHNPLHTVIFLIISMIITYILVFFMEMGLAQIADNGKISNSFNIFYIKKIIDKIGWKEYVYDYTLVILAISILTIISDLVELIPHVNFIIETFLHLMILVIEFGAIGLIYRKQKDTNKI